MAKRRGRRRLKKRPVIILILVLLSIFGGLYLYKNSKKYLFLKGIEQSYELVSDFTNNFINNYIPYINNDYYNKTDSFVNVVTSEIDSTIKFNGDIYLTNSSNYFDLKIDTNGEEYELDMLSKDDKLHFKVDDSRFYYTKNVTSNIPNKNYLDLIEVFIDSVKDNINNSNLEKESSSITINSNNLNTKKITFHIDNKKYKNIMKSFYSSIKDLKDDNVMLNTLLSITNYSTRKELIRAFESDSFSINNDIYLSIYLYKSNAIKVELSYDKNKSISFINYDKYIELDFKVDKTISYIKINNNKIDLFIDGIGYGSGSYGDSSFKIDFTDYNENSLGFISYTINKNNNKYFNELSIKLDLSDIDINIVSSNKIEVDKKIPNINVGDSLIVDDMPNDDKETLSKLLSNINLIFAF